MNEIKLSDGLIILKDRHGNVAASFAGNISGQRAYEIYKRGEALTKKEDQSA